MLAPRVLDGSITGGASFMDSATAILWTGAPAPFCLIEAEPRGEMLGTVASRAMHHPPPGDEGPLRSWLHRTAPAVAEAATP